MSALRDEDAKQSVRLLVNGGARGADTLAKEWALVVGAEVLTMPADWGRHGRAAGPMRNEQMTKRLAELRDHGNEVVVLAFHGGRGTADMVDRCLALGLSVIDLREAQP
jgi:hypothetical protein